MSSLTNALIGEVEEKVQVVYMDRGVVKFWNASKYRRDGEPGVFTGFYWVNGANEGGPFKTRSAAYRDAWYRLVQGVEPPAVGRQALRRNDRK